MQPLGPKSSADVGRERMSLHSVYVLAVMTLVYAVSIADRFIGSTLIEPIKREFNLSDSAVGFLTGAGVALFYCTAAIPLGVLADRANRRNMIAWSLLAWSLITMLCGLARNYWQLLVARLGVGIGEAGATPAQQSLLADYIPRRFRAVAMTIFSLGASLGSTIGAVAGGWLSEHHGWRVALIGVGALGLPLVVLVVLTVREPPRGRLDTHGDAGHVGLASTLRFCWTQRALRHVIIGTTLVTYWGWGLIWWTPAFLTRFHGLSLAATGALLGGMHGVGGSLVMIATALMVAATSRRGTVAHVWLICATTVLATIPSIIAYATDSPAVATAMLWLFVPMSYLYIGPTLALVQNLTPPAMRAQVAAIVLFTANIANLVLAPVFIGLISDGLRPLVGSAAESLRWALVGTGLLGLWGAAHYALCARHLQAPRAGGSPA